MDIYLVLFIVFIIIVLILTTLLNSNIKSQSFIKVIKKLSIQNPLLVGFNAGYDQIKKSYKNVYLEENLKYSIKYENNPISLDGRKITLNKHGKLSELENGFEVTGFDGFKFECPTGYYGPLCKAQPLCNETDINVLKPLTYEQFDELNLYHNTQTITKINETYSQQYHPRIRINCIEPEKYILEKCPDNKLLNANLKCIEYDICEDHLNGFRHNFKINESDPELTDNEYYLCIKNKSVKQKCVDGTVYDRFAKGCITKSICTGKENEQIKIDEHTYIQCKNGTGEKIQCPYGIVTNPETKKMHCKSENICKPNTFYYEDTLIKYILKKNICDENDNLTTLVCNDSSQYFTKDYIWYDLVKLSIAYPKEILDDETNTCKPANLVDLVKKRGYTEFNQSDAMLGDNKFNYQTTSYDCGSTKDFYEWDYINYKPKFDYNREKVFISSLDPCNTISTLRYDEPFYNLNFKENGDMPIVLHVESDLAHKFWPVYNIKKNLYYFNTFEFDYLNELIIIREYTNVTPPIQFYEYDNNDKNPEINGYHYLSVRGQKKFLEENPLLINNAFLFAHIPTNLRPTFTGNSTNSILTQYNAPRKVTINNKKQTFLLTPLKIKQYTKIDSKFELYPTYFIFNNIKYDYTLSTFTIYKEKDGTIILTYKNNKISINSVALVFWEE